MRKVKAIIDAVASFYGVTASDIKSDRRTRSLAKSRAVAMYIAHHHATVSYPDIALAFGPRHHTSIIASVRSITRRLNGDDSLRSEILAIEAMLR